ncbi:MAG: hypothetical protein LBC27_06115 [Spirochaetaceae bacterium]|nr:hypothetical protein [Spirochaetaceae bacterium]
MLKKQEYHYGREAEKHEMKMRQYRSFLEKEKRHEILKITALPPCPGFALRANLESSTRDAR